MINSNLLTNLNPLINLKLLKDLKINDLNDSELKEITFINLLKTQKYDDILNYIPELNLGDNIVEYLKEQINFTKQESNKIINNHNNIVKNFINEALNKQTELLENNYCKDYINSVRDFELISYSDKLYNTAIDISLIYFSQEKYNESLNILLILEKLIDLKSNLNILFAKFYLYFLKEDYNKSRVILENDIYNILLNGNYNINYYQSYVKYKLINDYYLNKTINYEDVLALYKLKGFSKSIEIDCLILFPIYICATIISYNKYKSLFKNILKINELNDNKENNPLITFLKLIIDNKIFIDNSNNFSEIENYLTNNLFLNAYKDIIIDKLKLYVLKKSLKVNNILTFTQLSNILNIKDSKDIQLFIINNKNNIKDDIEIDLKSESISITSSNNQVKEKNIQVNDLYNKIVTISKSILTKH